MKYLNLKSHFQKNKFKWQLLFDLPIILWMIFLLLNHLFPLPSNLPYSQVIVAKDGSILTAYLSSDDKWRMPLEPTEINDNLKKAILNKEDKYFYYHPGFNIVAIFKAITANVFFHKRVSGASTITMQVARLLQPKSRTYKAKFIELFRALQLEWCYSKSAILTMYLNLVPYGSNIEGVKSAAYLFFEKSPAKLSLAEATALSVIPNQPTSLQLGKNNAGIIKQRNKWLQRFAKEQLFDAQTIQEALNEPLSVTRKEAPKNAPHLSWRLKSNFSNLSIIHSTIDLKKQLQAESIVRQYMIPMKNKNVHNAAALVIDNDTHEVIAYIGSDDFNDLNFNGQVDGIQAIRSPGSTLKPFLYGLAMDKGLITPKTILADVPILITGYQPSNYDDKFRGLITAEYALANSLNIPAVKLLKDIGINEFIGKLDSAGFKSIVRQKKKLGLSLILGGCGASLEQITSLFSIFPSYGQYNAIKFNQPIDFINQAASKPEWDLLPYFNDAAVPAEKSVSLMSAPAAFMVTQILTTLTRPDLPNNFESSTNLVKIAWKTGTSYGRKDAWSIGYNKKYTIGVWVGNFNGTGVPDLNGADFATPLLFQLFNSLASKSSNEWFQMPSALQFRSICSESGNIPNTFCTNIITDNYIPQISSNELCSHLKPIYTNRKASLSYCTSCMPDTGAVQIYVPNYASSVIEYFESIKLNFKKIPTHNTACERIFTENDPVITSLNEGIIYYLDATESQQLKLLCQAANDVKTVFWFANGLFIKSSLVNNPVFITPNEGQLKITCVDDRGRQVNCQIEIKKMREEN